MALAPLVYTLWNRVMRFDPQDPIWPNGDRFVLSNGRASMLLWSVLHLTGVQAARRKRSLLFWPYMVPYSITVANAAAPEVSLSFLFYGGIVVLPVIALYTIGVYWVFRGKVRAGYS
jgi:cytochrome bd-type quinol oxidase subunit 2